MVHFMYTRYMVYNISSADVGRNHQYMSLNKNALTVGSFSMIRLPGSFTWFVYRFTFDIIKTCSRTYILHMHLCVHIAYVHVCTFVFVQCWRKNINHDVFTSCKSSNFVEI